MLGDALLNAFDVVEPLLVDVVLVRTQHLLATVVVVLILVVVVAILILCRLKQKENTSRTATFAPAGQGQSMMDEGKGFPE